MRLNRWHVGGLLLLLVASLFLLYRQIRPETLSTRLGSEGDHFGQMVVVHGDWLAVGAWGDSDRGNDAGALHLFERHNDSWVQIDKLYTLDAAPFQLFGASIALNDRLLAATSCSGRGIFESGRVHLFTRSGRSWTETATIDIDNCTTQSNLLAMTDTTLVVGVPGRREARIYTLQNGALTQTASVTPLETRLYSITDDFARLRAVAAENGRVIIALENGAGVFTFRQRGGEWVEQQKLNALDGTLSYGAAVALDGKRLLVGDPEATVCEGGACVRGGRVYVYELIENRWQQVTSLQPDPPAAESWFGGSLLLWGDTAIVGAPTEIAGSFGAAYRFQLCDGTWSQKRKLVAGPYPRTETAWARGLAETERSLSSRRFAADDLVSAIRGGFNYPIMIATGPALAISDDELLIGPTRGAINNRSSIYRFPFRPSC